MSVLRREQKIEKGIEISPYQQLILDWVKNGTGHATCHAVAGSGKGSFPLFAIVSLCKIGTLPRDRHPNAKDLALVIEVSDSTLERDRTIKQMIYAKSGIPIYWILNLSDRTLEDYTLPSDEDIYKECQILAETELVTLIINQIEIASFMVGKVL